MNRTVSSPRVKYSETAVSDEESCRRRVLVPSRQIERLADCIARNRERLRSRNSKRISLMRGALCNDAPRYCVPYNKHDVNSSSARGLNGVDVEFSVEAGAFREGKRGFGRTSVQRRSGAAGNNRNRWALSAGTCFASSGWRAEVADRKKGSFAVYPVAGSSRILRSAIGDHRESKFFEKDTESIPEIAGSGRGETRRPDAGSPAALRDR